MSSSHTTPRACVAIIGGATAGAEVASCLVDHGAAVVVFEQNPRPYGKVEDGLPSWHVGLRNKEYETIRKKLSRPGVHFVPNTKIGEDIPFESLVNDWGFGIVILANGAWRDRSLPVEGADAYIDKGLIYQNPLVIGFNHRDDPTYTGQIHECEDGALIVGGGLASIDVAKIHTLETTRAKLAERGIEVSTVKLEVAGIPKTLKAHGLEWKDLGLEGCTIFYRRRAEDMPLVGIPEGAPPERVAKVMNSRKKLLDKATTKFCFSVEALCSPDELIVEDGRLVGLRFRRTRMEDGRPVATDETFERRGPYVVSSIGSIPEPIPGIEMKGELFAFTDWDYGRLDAYPSVFSAGNVVTGKGNIVESRKHATHVSEKLSELYLGLDDEAADRSDAVTTPVLNSATDVANKVAQRLDSLDPPSAEQLTATLARVRARQDAVDYPEDFKTWIEQVGLPEETH